MTAEQPAQPGPDGPGFTGAIGALIEAVRQLDARLTAIEKRLDRDRP